MGERLYETVKDAYDLKNITKTRKDFYIFALEKIAQTV
jgi:hypothetical protein